MNPLTVVEPASLLILGVFLTLMLRRGLAAQAPASASGSASGPAEPDRRRRALVDLALLGGGAWLAEDTCIRLYDFYQYDAPWRLFLDRVPLLVAVIWPFVILSAREVCHGLGLRTADGLAHPVAVGVMVIYDAALVEPIAVQAGLWSWNEPGIFDVPLIGLLGWGLYAGVASACLDRLHGARRIALLLIAPLATHGLLVAAWWGGLRWGLRDPWPPAASVALSVTVGSAFTAIFFQWRRVNRMVDLATMAPRMLAAALFFGLLFWRGGAVLPLVLYALPFAGPYFMATRYRARRPA